MEIKKLSTDDDYARWDSFVSSSSNGTIFHKSFWLTAWGGDFDIWGTFKGNNLVGGFVAPCRKYLGMDLVAPPPLTPYSGIVFPSSKGKYTAKLSNEKELAAECAAFLKKRYKWGIISLDPTTIDMQPFIWDGFEASPHYTYILDAADIDQVWKNMVAERRNDIRKAENDGLSVIVAPSFEPVIDLVEKTFQRQDMSPRWKDTARRYYDALDLRGLCKGFLCVDAQGNNIATCFIIWDEKRAYYLLGGYDAENKHHGGSALCLWEAIRFTSLELGLKEFDFEGSMVPQIERSFRKFGGQLTPYYQIRWGLGVDAAIKFRKLLKRRFRS